MCSFPLCVPNFVLFILYFWRKESLFSIHINTPAEVSHYPAQWCPHFQLFVRHPTTSTSYFTLLSFPLLLLDNKTQRKIPLSACFKEFHVLCSLIPSSFSIEILLNCIVKNWIEQTNKHKKHSPYLLKLRYVWERETVSAEYVYNISIPYLIKFNWTDVEGNGAHLTVHGFFFLPFVL